MLADRWNVMPALRVSTGGQLRAPRGRLLLLGFVETRDLQLFYFEM